MQTLPTKERFSVPVSEVPYDRIDWKRGYQSQPNEYDYSIDDIEGKIPADLQGTLFRNGPGLLEVNGQRLHHPFDGDGWFVRSLLMVVVPTSAIGLFALKAFSQNRRQEKFSIVAFSVLKSQGVYWQMPLTSNSKILPTPTLFTGVDKLLALWEAAEPHRLDPKTLETIGKDYLNGVLEEGDAFAAHPRIDPSCKQDGVAPCLVNFSIKPGLSSTITIYEFNPAGKLLRRQSRSIPGFAFIHDFAITPNYCIFFQNPVSFNPIPFLLGFRGAGECVKLEPDKPTRIVVIPRHSKEPMRFLETRSGFIFHHANAFEQDDTIYIDSICYESFPEVESGSDFREVDFDLLAPGQLWRFTLNLSEQTVTRRLLEERCCEFPYVHPNHMGRPYRYLFMGAAHRERGNAPLQAILKLDATTGEEQVWSAAPKGYVSEPIFVPRPDGNHEDDGWVMTVVYDANKHCSDVVILDGCDLNRGPVARLHLKHHIPYGLHGSWTPDVF
jgi:all-trans-8'-apo-beta-carotenal 15,15'-oxygenase